MPARDRHVNDRSVNGDGAMKFFTLFGIAMLLALVPVSIPVPVEAQVAACAQPDPVLDSDSDGLTDAVECGIPAPLTIGNLTFGPCPSPLPADVPRASCLDPNSRDLFVAIVRQPGSLIPADPLQFVANLAVTPHEIPDTSASREIPGTNPVQHYLRITESLDPDGDVVGQANYGTPQNLDESVVFTLRIANHVNSIYAGAGQQPPPGKTETYIKHTIAHELAHMALVTTDYNARFGGHHYKSGSAVIMEQSVAYSVKGSRVTFDISTTYAAPDPASAVLK